MLDKDHVAKIAERNPRVDATAVERSRKVARKLAELGIKLGGYRLEPPLGGGRLKNLESERPLRSRQPGR